MLWYKAWLETRSRFLIELIGCLALCPRLVVNFMRNGSYGQPGQVLHAAREILAVVWLLAVTLIMMGGLLREKAIGSSSFTLSLPVSRLRLMSVCVGLGLVEAIVLATLPWTAIALCGDRRFIHDDRDQRCAAARFLGGSLGGRSIDSDLDRKELEMAAHRYTALHVQAPIHRDEGSCHVALPADRTLQHGPAPGLSGSRDLLRRER
jgi:hypothetical protein